MRYICTSIVATLVLAGTSLPVWAVDCYFPNTKELFVADSPNDSEFGSDIATSGSRILVGRTAAWYPDFPIGGGAHIYERQADNTWLSIAILGASDATQDDQFGFSVALDGDTAVVSAPGNGSAYVYQRQADDSWLESAKLTAVGPGETMRQVAISDGVVLMSCYRYSENHCEGYPCNESPSCPAGEIADCHGNCVPAYWVGDQFCDNGAFSWNGIPIYLNCALHNCDQYTCDYNTDCDGIGDQPGACCMGTSCLPMTEADCQLAGGTYLGSRDVLGRVYVYERQSDGNWVATATLQPPMGTSGAYFGWGSIALSGNVAVIGSHADATNGRLSGCAFVYERQGNGQWLMTAKLTASDGDRFAQLGRSVSVSDDIVVVGAPDDDIGGSAYVFERQENGAWLETAKLLASDVENDDHFGWDVSISNQIATIGAMADDDVGINCGSLHVFERLPDASWLATSKLTPPDGGDYDLFGRGCALSGDILAVSSYGQQSGTTSGTVYVYERQTLDCNANGCGDWSDILNGTSLDCNANTLPDECDIDNGTVEDCDEDGVPDSCALADGDVPDCNLNGVPDSCDIANGGDADGDGYLDECKIWTVDDDGPADFDTIQAAVDHATDGNEIVVMPGVYTGSGDQVVATFDKSYLIIRASGSVEETIIDGEGQRRCIAGNSGSYEGFTIRGGWTDGDGGGIMGYGSSWYSMHIRECVIKDNSAPKGLGGGAWGSSLSLTDCTIQNNTALLGGGVCFDGWGGNLSNCVVSENNALDDSTVGDGSGIYIRRGVANVTGCQIRNNQGYHPSRGVGISVWDPWDNNDSSLNLTDSVVEGHGSHAVKAWDANLVVTNCQLINNQGRGIRVSSDGVAVIDSTIAGNTSGGIYFNYCTFMRIINSSIIDNIGSECGGIQYNGVSFHQNGYNRIQGCTISGNDGPVGGIKFVGNYQPPSISATTVCGNALVQISGEWNDDGGNTIADECNDCPDINGDGEVGVDEILAIIAAWDTDDADADVNGDGIVSASDILLVLSAWGLCP